MKSPASSYGSQQSGGSNNNAGMCSMSPSAYSNPSPSYPSAAVSPYNVQISSPANSVSSIASGVAGIKSPVASPQNIRPPTPQPIMQQQAFQQIPVMTSGPNLVQIIQAPGAVPTGYQNQQQQHMLATRQTILAPQPQVQQQQQQQQNTQNSGQAQSVIKIKPPLNILPKPPPSTTGNKSNATRNTPQQSATIQQATPQQIVLPNQAILPTAQAAGTLVLNQMPLIVQQNTAQGVQLILRPGTPTSGQISGKIQPQNLILQQGPTQQPAVLIQHGQARPGQTVQQPQQLVRVLTANGVIQGLAPAYIMNNIQQLPNAQPQAQPQQSQPSIKTQPQQQIQQIQQGVIGACVQPQVGATSSTVATIIDQLPPPKRKPKKKKKNKEPKLDLANIMKLSGIGDDDDVHFESDTSESALSTDAQIKISKPDVTPPASTPTTPEIDTNQLNFPKRIGNIHISAVTQDIGKISQNTSQTNAILEKHFMQTSMSQISVQQSLSDISAINQNLTQIGILNSQNSHNFLGTNLSGTTGNVNQNATPNLLNQDGQGLANFLQALNQNSTFPVLNGQPQSSTVPGLTTFSGNVQTSNYQKIATSSAAQTSNANFGTNFVTNLVTSNQSISSDNVINLPKVTSLPQTTRPTQSPILSNQNIQNINQNNQNNTILSNQISNIGQNVPTLTNFNLSNPLSNIQVQNFGSQNLFLNQGTNTIIAPNIPNFSGNITINNGLIPNANLTLQNNLVPNFLQTNIVQPTDVNSGFNTGVQRTTGGFKLALSEDGRLILQHDPTLNQDIQSQLLLQSIFGISIPGNNLVLTSVSQPTPVQQPQVKPIAVVEPKKQEITSTKTTSIIQNSIPSIRTEIQPQTESQNPPVTTNTTTPPNNFSYIVNLTPDQLETLKRNGQLTVNGQTIFMHRPKGSDAEKSKNNNKTKTIKKKAQINVKSAIQEHLVSKTETKTMTSVATQSSNSSLISALQAPAKNAISHNVATSIMENKSILDPIHGTMPSNVVCVQPNNSKIAPVQTKIEETQQQLLPPQPKIMLPRRPLSTESTIVSPKEVKKEETPTFENGDINVEQFLNNLNINPTSLGQLISQKLPGGIEHKIVNISPGQTPGQIVAKIDIGMEHTTSMQVQETSDNGNTGTVPPLVSMNVKSETTENVFNGTLYYYFLFL